MYLVLKMYSVQVCAVLIVILTSILHFASCQYSIEITGRGVEQMAKEKNKKLYLFKSTREGEVLNLTCTFRRPPRSQSKFTFEFEGYPDTLLNEKKNQAEYIIQKVFELNSSSKYITCNAKESNSITPWIHKAEITISHESTASTSTTVIPDREETWEEHTGSTTSEKNLGDSGFIKSKLTWMIIGGLGVIVLCSITCLIAVCYRKKPPPLESPYANITNDLQVSPSGTPLPSPPRKKPRPKLEAGYCDPKDLTDMSEAMYADPGYVTRKEETYAEPYLSKTEIYAKPIPKAERKKKVDDGNNYSNVFGMDYVNSSGRR